MVFVGHRSKLYDVFLDFFAGSGFLSQLGSNPTYVSPSPSPVLNGLFRPISDYVVTILCTSVVFPPKS